MTKKGIKLRKSLEDKAHSTLDSKQNQELKSQLQINKSWSDQIALLITDTFGTIKFLCLILIFFCIWISWNLNLLPGLNPFDPYPFTMLNMIVSLFAIILSVSVLISQNRQGRMDKINHQVEFEVNVRAENEITNVLIMLHEIQKKMGIDSNITETELEEMKEIIDIQQIHHNLNDKDNI